jgi:hypothetical protein
MGIGGPQALEDGLAFFLVHAWENDEVGIARSAGRNPTNSCISP